MGMEEAPRVQAAPTARVFLAEDNDDLADLITRRLQGRIGWRVVRARTAEEASAQLQGDRFDVVVLDYRFPDGTGLELLKVLRASSPQTPVLFLTAHGSEKVALEALGLGASDYMQKDAQLFDELPRRLGALLDRSDDIATSARVVPIRTSLAAHPPAHEALLPDATRALDAVRAAVHGDVIGAAVFDGAGHPLAAILPDGMDATRLGAAAFQLHAQVGIIGRLADLTPRAYAFQMEVDGAFLAMTTVTGRGILAVLLDPRHGNAARDRLAQLADRLS